jgi:IS605 OrfB family transposase
MLVVDPIIDDAQIHPYRQSLALFRHVCRQAFAVYGMAAAAGAEIIEREKKRKGETLTEIVLNPSNDRAKHVLAELFDHKKKDGEYYKPQGYELRPWLISLAPTCRTFVADLALRKAIERWKAKDPQFTQARRGYLVLQGAREVGRFGRVGITLPLNQCRPEWSDRGVTVDWDREIGRVKFRLPRLDQGRWRVWEKVRSGEYPPGSITLTTNKHGGPRLLIPYTVPTADHDLDFKRVLEVAFDTDDPSACFKAKLVGGRRTIVDDIRHDELSAVAALAGIDRLKAQQDKCERERSACGNRRARNRGEGHPKAFRAISRRTARLTKARTNTVRTWNHTWAARLVHLAVQYAAGNLVVADLPANKSIEGAPASHLFGRPWAWSEFQNILKSKAAAAGVAVTIMQSATLEGTQ